MNFSIPKETLEEKGMFKAFLDKHLSPQLSQWFEQGAVPRSFFSLLAEQGWFSFSFSEGRIVKNSALREALIAEELAKTSPEVAVAILAHQDLGLTGLWLFGSPLLQKAYGPSAVLGKALLCIGNTESGAGSDSANIEDVEELAAVLLERAAARAGRRLRFGPGVVAALRERPWPGNVRELENAIERAVVLAEGDVLEAESFIERAGRAAAPRAAGHLEAAALSDVVADAERSAILRALDQAGGNRPAAAKLLDVSQRTLYYKMRAYGVG